jgi:DNA-binding NarL/FixJ family response regulator
VLVLSMFDETAYASKCLKAGARGYVMKSEPPMKILDALRIVLGGEVYLSSVLTNQVLRQIAGDATPEHVSIVERLSHRELEVFRMLGHGLTSVHIARRMNLSRKTIQTYREHIKAKLDIPHATELIRRATQWVQAEQKIGMSGTKKTAD